jgi:hypothetical protein
MSTPLPAFVFIERSDGRSVRIDLVAAGSEDIYYLQGKTHISETEELIIKVQLKKNKPVSSADVLIIGKCNTGVNEIASQLNYLFAEE